ncbi:MAG: DUF1003 domain-containing protein [Bacteriovorax sp.]|nr:DUF1003 domain-containing protein [Bacteriovorax sp.]
MSNDIRDLLNEEEVQAKELECIVAKSIEEDHMLSSKLHEVEREDDATFGQRVSDKVAAFGGSWTFILGFIFFIIIWIIMNVMWIGSKAADPYPFILLNLMLSCLAAFQAPIIMMSQNRQEEKDRRRARSDFMINLKAEMEIRNLHDKLDAFQKVHHELVERLIKEKKLD